MPSVTKPSIELPIKLFKDQQAWYTWLDKYHDVKPGVWLRVAKKDSGQRSVSCPEALEIALCYGWIDGTRKAEDEQYFLQKYTPRSARSIWSKINRDKVLALIESGLMKPAGMKEVERAKASGRWDAAYDSAKTATMPSDLSDALDASPRAKAFFVTLNATNRYAILFRIQTAKKAETRARRIKQFVEMLERHEKLHP